MCHNLGPSLTIIMDDGDQYFKIKIMSKKFHNMRCQILINEWQLTTSTWHDGWTYNEIA